MNRLVLTGAGAAPDFSAPGWPVDESPVVRETGWGWVASALVNVDDESPSEVETRLRDFAQELGAGGGLVTGPLATEPPALLVMDVDSTLTTTEAIDLLAAEAGAGAHVAEITERAMRGELDFGASLRERVATLKGLPVEVFATVATQITLSQGAEALIAAAHQVGAKVAVVSGGFIELVEPMARELSIDLWSANRLEVEDGQLSGRTIGPVIDREAKAATLLEFAGRVGTTPDRVIAVGDGANDLLMLSGAGVGIAYCAKPRVVAQARHFVPFSRLDAVSAWFTG